MEGKINVIRVGQLTGDTINGCWNMSEAWPLILSTAKDLKCLPKIQQKLDWLPVDVAAKGIVDIAMIASSAKNTASVYHVVQDSSGNDWSDLLRWLAKMEKFEVVEPAVWIEKLEGKEQHPAKRLLWLWKKAYGADGGGGKTVKFNTKQAMRASKALGGFKGVDEELVGKIWIWISSQTREI